MRRVSGIIVLSLACAAALAPPTAAPAAERWTRFTSPTSFTLDRPLSWRLVDDRPDRLHLVSGPCLATGAAICRGESQIVVISEPVTTPKPSRATSCWSLEERRSEDAIAPERGDAVQNSRRLTCTIRDRRFSIYETHWKGDRNAARYDRTAMRIAKSLRYPPAKPPESRAR